MSTDVVEMLPMDKHNKVLLDHVHPSDWKNPSPQDLYDMVVIGAGPAGLITSLIGAGTGAKVALIERHLMGGDCLNVGCVPSKCLIASGKAVGNIRDAGRLGVKVPDGVEVDFAAVMERMRAVRAGISHHDSAERYTGKGIDVFIGSGNFVDDQTVAVGDAKLKFRKAVIATGNRAAKLPIPGLEEVGYLNNETVFQLAELPKRLAVIGGGPIGCELAQAFRRFGAELHLLEVAPQILIREDRDAAKIVENALIKDGINLITGCKIKGMEQDEGGKTIRFDRDGAKGQSIQVDEILLAVGRAPNVEGLNLDKVGVEWDERSGVKVNDYLQTANPRIFAAGDICFPYKFTHVADAMAKIVFKNALASPFGFSKWSTKKLVIPWATYTDPEIAHVGMYDKDAEEAGIAIDTFTHAIGETDRGLADGDEEGFVKVHVKKGTGTIVGATIVAKHAGDLISLITTAMVNKLSLGSLGNVIFPYPTQAEAIKRVAGAYNLTTFKPWKQKVVNFVRKLS
ncbi:MAG: mercuric reductase [Planctomycetota bacterium]|nr:mercuric reductase [Planctomycetota bacterium]